jgi:hypothetical protein
MSGEAFWWRRGTVALSNSHDYCNTTSESHTDTQASATLTDLKLSGHGLPSHRVEST